jgi:hypothetical protein
MEVCTTVRPDINILPGDRQVACHLYSGSAMGIPFAGSSDGAMMESTNSALRRE